MDQRCVTSKVVNDGENADVLMELRTLVPTVNGLYVAGTYQRGAARKYEPRQSVINGGDRFNRTGSTWPGTHFSIQLHIYEVRWHHSVSWLLAATVGCRGLRIQDVNAESSRT